MPKRDPSEEAKPLRGEWCCEEWDYAATWKEGNAHALECFCPRDAKDVDYMRDLMKREPSLIVRCSRCGNCYW